MKKTIPVNVGKRLMFIFLCMYSIGIFAQNINVTGFVTDSKNEPLIGVTLKIIGESEKGTVTDFDGKYVLPNIPSNAKIEVSYVGMQKQVIDVKGRTTINIVLSEDTELLDEVVVVAYGVQKKVSVTGAISTVSTKDLRVSTSPSLANALSGRIAGLTSMQRVGGQPGADDATMYLRGAATINGTNPLILIDGVPRDNIRTLDINEVESISVLKDASATAVFGVRGANGVLIITTKRGTEGKPELSVNVTQSFSKLTREPEMPGSVEYMNLRNEALANDGLEPAFSPDIIAKFENPLAGLDPNDPDYASKAALRKWMYPNNNWYQMLVRRWSPQTNVNTNMSGGTDKVSYFLNVGYLHQGGNMNTLSKDILKYDPSYKLDRYSFRSNIDYKVTKWMTAYLNLGTYIEKQNMPNPGVMYGGDWRWMTRDLMYQAQTILPISPGPSTLPGFGVPADRPLDPTYLTVGHYADRSPVMIMNWYGYNLDTRSNLNSSFGLDFDLGAITQGLSLKGMISYDAYGNSMTRGNMFQTDYQAFIDPETDELTFSVYGLKQDNFYMSYGEGSRYNINVQGQLLYNRTFGNHTVGGMLRTERDHWDSGSNQILFNVLGFAGRATYDYASRYFAEVNFGYNGSEQFSPTKRFGFFPSISAGWAISNESFLQDNPVITFLKLRASYGKVGNDKMGGYRFLYLDDNSMGGGFSGSLAAGKGVNEGLLGNKMITWETADKYNLGLDFSIMKDITGQVELFRENRTDILLTRQSIPIWQGTPLNNIPKVNMGEIQNKGYEIELGYNKQVNKDLFINIKGQLSYNRNKQLKMDEVPRDETYAYRYRSTGYPLGQNWGYLIDWDQDGGYWTEETLADPNKVTYDFGTPGPGDFVYKDLNNDGVVNDRDQAPIGVGNIPRYSYGASFSAQWKGFDAYIFFQGLAKFNSTFAQQGTWEYTIRGTYFPYHKTAWTQERWENGDKITYPALHTGATTNHMANSFFVFDRDLFRLKNFEIGYTLPQNTLKVLGISNLRIFLNGQNVLTWSPKFRPYHLDPENDDSIGYPQTSIFSFGTNIKF
ncbi:MAG: TonB-dependent receptor [Petrimonas sp.]|jgi:TonB-linked SusC/RagA family outer membrane protein|uniref:SusC/RagA family TonB-linked outer membrane protein n=1 Tax=Petrimonas sp. TaxID=2023866 RepID=UPI002B375D0C|nr:TonB-dependent receptor [Petrimonas sp.]MEA5045184.1 TonB-dependent receptor [Petrimonas sp.]